MTALDRPPPPPLVPADGDGRALRRAFGAFATGVTIIACPLSGGRLAALTANSFSSLSLDPPLLLWSLGRGAPCFEAFAACSHFSVNVLAAGQRDLADHFARPHADKFASVPHHRCRFGTPLLDGAAATYVCAAEARHDGGDHVIFVGRVAYWHHREAEPLVFFGGRYRELGQG